MKPAQVTFPLAPLYERAGIEFIQASAREIHPEGDQDNRTPYVTADSGNGTDVKVPYDFLINATGPALRFDKTDGLGPDGGNSLSVCLPSTPRRRRRRSARRSSGCDAVRTAGFSSAWVTGPDV